MTRRVEYVPLDEVQGNPQNAKLHATEGIVEAMTRFGVIDLPVIDERTGLLVSGHGRVEAIRAAEEAGEDPPEGVRVDFGTWMVPVERGWYSADDDEALAAGIGLNAWVEKGGWDRPKLVDLLDEQSPNDMGGFYGLGFSETDREDLRRSLLPQGYNPESDGHGNARREASIDELAAEYRNKQVRTLVLDYPLDEYQEVIGLAGAARKTHGVEGNAELLMSLLRRWDASTPE